MAGGEEGEGVRRGQDGNEPRTPVLDQPDDESAAEGRYGRQGEPDLLRDAVLYQIHVGGDAGGDLAGAQLIEIGHVLTHNGSQIPRSKLLRDMFSGIDETDCGSVDGHKLYHSEVDEVEGLSGQDALEGRGGDRMVHGITLECAGQRSKDNLRPVSQPGSFHQGGHGASP